MDDGSILIVTSHGDMHADVVARFLRREGFDPVIAYPSDLPTTSRLTARIDDAGWSGRLRDRDGRAVGLAGVRVVWWRKPVTSSAPAGLSGEYADLAVAEAEQALKGAWALLDADPGRFWMSHPRRIGVASVKIEQLDRAARLGFDVPRSLVTNDPEWVRAFYDECRGKVVFKALNQSLPGVDTIPAAQPVVEGRPEARLQMVSPVRPEHLDKLESVRHAPGLFQETVEKSVELRVTVIDGQFFTAGIGSQADERTRHDWRHWEVPLQWAAVTLSDALSQLCLDLLDSYGLTFGAFDFVVTPDGRCVFLELNPNGQWMFVQDLVPELKLTQCMAETLIRHASESPTAQREQTNAVAAAALETVS